jgi:hypothetical protein
MRPVNIAPFSPNLSLFPTTPRSGSGRSNAPVSNSPDQNSTDPKDIIAQIASGGSTGLIKYQEKQIADKARKDVLNSLGLTEADLKNLPPQKESAVEDAIAKAVKDALKNSIQGDGKSNAASAGSENSKAAAAPTTRSLISSDTLNALFDAQ